jgi:A/G-specific adenine glycosylase
MHKRKPLPIHKSSRQFAQVLLQWFDQFGRKNLPWQQDITPYRVWLSEIMLQQTQVSTVIPYFENFIGKFPTVELLAQAPANEVLHYWTGLGYYARARNLHKTAKIVCAEHQGLFPNTLAELIALPGIGRSTAGAILSIAFNISTSILDGNVKRVLSRYHAISGHYSEKSVENLLWQHANEVTPDKRCADYTQAIMDLGATVCTRTKPNCLQCPLSLTCIAHQQGLTAVFPNPKKRAALPIRQTHFLILLTKQGKTLLYKRPDFGVWGGLWSFPESSLDAAWIKKCEQEFNLTVIDHYRADSFRHTFSHFHLDITPIYVRVNKINKMLRDDTALQWFDPKALPAVGLAAPVKKLLESLKMSGRDGLVK